MLKSSPHHPKTSQPTPKDFVEAYEPFKDQPVVSIHLSAELSGTYESARAAKKTLEDPDITIVDSRLCTIGLGLIVVKAARAAQEGASKDDVLGLVDNLLNEVGFYFSVDTLEYLAKGGRVGKAQELLGTLLKVKPILTRENGAVAPKAKVRGRAKVFDKLVELMKEKGAAKKKGRTVLLAGIWNEDRLVEFKERLDKEFSVDEFMISKVGSVIGTHTGPGAIMCAWV